MLWPVELRLLMPLGIAFALSLIVTPLVRRIARQRGLVAAPSPDRWHRRTVALFGGVAIFITVITTCALAFASIEIDRRVLVLAAGATAMFVLGLIDDVLTLKPFTKLMVQVSVACVMVVFGFSLHWFVNEPLDATASIFWIVGVTNAFNLLDNMDGLASGIGLIAAAGVVLSGAETLDPGVSAFALAVIGALAGFLVFNFQPATIFMGDSGSLFIGMSLALLVLAPDASNTGIIEVISVPTLILLIPIVDTTLVTISRKLSGRAASAGGTDHLSHRLVALGYSERRAVAILYVLAALGGLAGSAVREFGASVNVLIAILVVALVLFGVRLARVKVYEGGDFALLRNRRYTPLLSELTYKRRLFELVLDVVLIVIAYYSAYQIRFEGAEFRVYYPRFVESLPIVIGCKVVSLYFGGVYKGVWRYFGLSDLGAYVGGVALGSATSVMALVLIYRFGFLSRGVFIIDALMLLLLLIGSRLSFRAIGEMAHRRRNPEQPVVIYGAGDGGALLVRELMNNRRHGYSPIGFIDDDRSKEGRQIHGLTVFGGVDALPRVLERKQIVAVLLSTSKIQPERLIVLRHWAEEVDIPLIQLRFALHELRAPA
jgi:UDP-GlcNAc:undecaprenyl-phosphate GlcNAc-1-phosphate transferase